MRIEPLITTAASPPRVPPALRPQPWSRPATTLLVLAALGAGTAHASPFSDVREIGRLTDEPIENVVLGEPAFSAGAVGYVHKQLADLDSVPFGEGVTHITLTTDELDATEYDDKPVTIIWRKPADPKAPRRRPLTIYNYGNIAVYNNARSVLVYGIPSRGLAHQFALVLRFHYKHRFHKDVAVEIVDENSGEHNAADKNYARLTSFFQSVKMADVGDPACDPKEKATTYTLVFGYKKVVDSVWEPLTKAKEFQYTNSGWQATFYKHLDGSFKDESTCVVTLDSDVHNSYHVEVLAQNILGLIRSKQIKVKHLVFAGSGGWIGDAPPDRYTFIYPALKLDAGSKTYANAIGDYLQRKAIIGDQSRFIHTSVPSVLVESNAAMTVLRDQHVTSVDMEFAYVLEALQRAELAVPLFSVAVLITDFPWKAPVGTRLAEKGEDEKKQKEIEFATQLGLALGALVQM